MRSRAIFGAAMGGAVAAGVVAAWLAWSRGGDGLSAPEADPSPRPAGWNDAVEAAASYFASTQHPVTIDAAVSLEVAAELSGDARPLEALRARKRNFGEGAYGVLLGMKKPPFAPSSLDGWSPHHSEPDPSVRAPSIGSDAVERCLGGLLRCDVDDECVRYLSRDGEWGYSLTHQGVGLLFARWVGCDLPFDVNTRRHVLGANLLAEARADPDFSDLAVERTAVLGHLGFARHIDPAWIRTTLDARLPAGCWPSGNEPRCHPHPTALALWTIAHAARAGRWPR